MMIVKAEKNDIPELVRLRLAYLAEDTGFKNDEEKETVAARLPAYFEKHLNEDLTVFLAKEDGKTAACAFLLVTEMPMSPSFPNGRTGTVLNVYTDPSCRRQGYGRAVMTELLAEGKRLDLSRIELKATKDGYPLYQKLGFRDSSKEYPLMKWVYR